MSRYLLVSVVALAAATPAWAHGPDHGMSGGKPGDPVKVTRTVEVVAADNEFSLKVKPCASSCATTGSIRTSS